MTLGPLAIIEFDEHLAVISAEPVDRYGFEHANVRASPLMSETRLPCFQHSISSVSGSSSPFGERDVLVSAAVADGVKFVSDPAEGNPVAPDVQAFELFLAGSLLRHRAGVSARALPWLDQLQPQER